MHIDKVLIADDHELVLTGIHRILTNKFTINNICMFTDPNSVISTIEGQFFDLYIIDIELGEISGFELINIILRKDPLARIIICTMHEEIWYVNRLLSSGAKGILLKRSSLEDLEQAIKAVMNNEEYLCPRFQKLKHSAKNHLRSKPQNYQLTQTELTVLKYVVEGHKSKEIASFMFVTEDTIEAHRKNLFIKLGTRNVAQLVSIAIRHNLVD